MKHCIYIILILVLGQCSISSQKTTYTTSPQLQRNIDDSYSTKNCFASTKIDSIFKHNKKARKAYPPRISDEDYDSLNDQDKIIYALEHPESYYQICSLPTNPKKTGTKLMANLPMSFDEVGISRKQRNYLENHRDSTIVYLNNCINQSVYVSRQYKELILTFNFYECVPTLIKKIEQPEQYDTQILTTLMLLMKYDKYPSFLESKIYEKLYIPKKGEEYIDRKSSIPKSDKKIQEIIGFANAFYQEKMKK